MFSLLFDVFSLLFVLGLPCFLVFYILFAIPMIHGDKKSKGMLDDLNSSPVDYTE